MEESNIKGFIKDLEDQIKTFDSEIKEINESRRLMQARINDKIIEREQEIELLIKKNAELEKVCLSKKNELSKKTYVSAFKFDEEL